MEEYRTIGKRLPRLEGAEKATGGAKYSVDIELPGMIYGKILRSPYAHAKILHIDATKAKRLSGVKAIVPVKEKVPKIQRKTWRAESLDLLLDQKLRYMGEEVVAVAAVDEDTAEEALELIGVDYEVLPPVTNPERAIELDAPKIHEEGNIADEFMIERGNIEEGFQRADYISEERFSTQNQHQGYLEPYACVADFHGTGKLTVWLGSMFPSSIRLALAMILGMKESKVRIIQPHLGGAFGAKIDMHSIHASCALLAKESGRPVRLVNTTEEEFLSTMPREAIIFQQKIGVKKDGRILAKQLNVIGDNGAYLAWGRLIIRRAAMAADSLYNITNIKSGGKIVYTNKPTIGPYRGFGFIEGFFAFESHLDLIAKKMGLDPMEVRLKNATLKSGDVTIHGEIISTCGFRECVEKVANIMGWKKRGKEGRGAYRFGMGMGSSMYVSAVRLDENFSGSVAFAKILEDGRVTIVTGEAEYGQGALNVFAQIAAEVLGLALEDIEVPLPDTDVTPFALGPYGGGRITQNAGNAVKMACEDAKKQVLQIASEMLEANPEDLEMERGRIYIKGSPDRFVILSQVAQNALYRRGGSLIIGKGVAELDDTYPIDWDRMYGNWCNAYTFSAHMAQVAVDMETGLVKVVNYGAATDCGQPINLNLAEGQVEGQIVQGGIGYGLLEEIMWEDGKTHDVTLSYYKMPTSLEIPQFYMEFINTHDPYGPFGAKALGRIAIVAAPATIANAIYDATGIGIKDLPITPDKIIEALSK